jgi:hypothetical protein
LDQRSGELAHHRGFGGTPALHRPTHHEKPREMPVVGFVAVIFIADLVLVKALGHDRGRHHAATATAAHRGEKQKAGEATVFAAVFVLVHHLVVLVHVTSHHGARHQALTAAARRREKEKTRKAMILATVFILVLALELDAIVHVPADHGIRHQTAAAAAPCGSHKQEMREVMVFAIAPLFVHVFHILQVAIFVESLGRREACKAAAAPTPGEHDIGQAFFVAAELAVCVVHSILTHFPLPFSLDRRAAPRRQAIAV